MINAAELPTWVALSTSFLVLLGAGITLIGAIGLSRLNTFYERMHAPTLGATWGAGAILLGSILFFSIDQSRPVFHEVLIAVFLTVTTPVTLMLLARAALYRDRSQGNPDVPPALGADSSRSQSVSPATPLIGRPERKTLKFPSEAATSWAVVSSASPGAADRRSDNAATH